MFEQNVAAVAPSGNSIIADENTAAGQRDIHWEVTRIR